MSSQTVGVYYYICHHKNITALPLFLFCIFVTKLALSLFNVFQDGVQDEKE